MNHCATVIKSDQQCPDIQPQVLVQVHRPGNVWHGRFGQVDARSWNVATFRDMSTGTRIDLPVTSLHPVH